jgi:hypothetical protein
VLLMRLSCGMQLFACTPMDPPESYPGGAPDRRQRKLAV